jgi:hypothetical protein
MKKSILIGQTALIALLAIPLGSHAQSWTCKQGNTVREILIQTATPGSPVPCSVVYKKTTEGVADQTLWNATNDAAYCEEKAKGLADKLNSLGWNCQGAAAAGAAASAVSTTTKP